MFKRWFWRLIVGICFAIPLGIIVAATAEAQSSDLVSVQEDCQGCHEIVQSHWASGGHATALSDPVFQAAWAERGKPDSCLNCHTTGFDPATGEWEADGVACTVCHSPASENHPEEIMPTDVSSRLCGQCHLDTYADWQESVHGQEDLACVRCHSPHTTDIRATDAQALCQSCHNTEAHFYDYTGHAEEGLLCSDCHLRVEETQMGEGHGSRMHEFTVDLDTCSRCHSTEMHYPTVNAMAMAEQGDPEDITLPMNMPPMQIEPDPVSPYGFAIIAALIGMGFGIVLAPWLENWFRRIRGRN